MTTHKISLLVQTFFCSSKNNNCIFDKIKLFAAYTGTPERTESIIYVSVALNRFTDFTLLSGHELYKGNELCK